MRKKRKARMMSVAMSASWPHGVWCRRASAMCAVRFSMVGRLLSATRLTLGYKGLRRETLAGGSLPSAGELTAVSALGCSMALRHADLGDGLQTGDGTVVPESWLIAALAAGGRSASRSTPHGPSGLGSMCLRREPCAQRLGIATPASVFTSRASLAALCGGKRPLGPLDPPPPPHPQLPIGVAGHIGQRTRLPGGKQQAAL